MAILLVFTLGLISCEDDFSGPPTTATYDLPSFSRIELETVSNISVYQSSVFQVIVEGRESDVNDTEVFVSGDLLVIREHGSIHPDQHITIYVPAILELDSYGSSYIYGETEFTQTIPLNIHDFGSGDIDFFIRTDVVNVRNTGSGDIILSGKADILDVELTGSGWVRSFLMPAEIANIFLSGSGSAEVTVDVDLDVVLSGSGDVFYKGHPLVDITVTGSGHVEDVN